jgi:hypothetical protein
LPDTGDRRLITHEEENLKKPWPRHWLHPAAAGAARRATDCIDTLRREVAATLQCAEVRAD